MCCVSGKTLTEIWQTRRILNSFFMVWKLANWMKSEINVKTFFRAVGIFYSTEFPPNKSNALCEVFNSGWRWIVTEKCLFFLEFIIISIAHLCHSSNSMQLSTNVELLIFLWWQNKTDRTQTDRKNKHHGLKKNVAFFERPSDDAIINSKHCVNSRKTAENDRKIPVDSIYFPQLPWNLLKIKKKQESNSHVW